MSRPEHPSVLVVGGGAFGTSTAYHLSRRGYSNVTVLDRFDTPSKDAASTDLNKVIRYDYPDPLYTKLALEAMEEWKKPMGMFAGMFRPTGWLMAAHDLALEFLRSAHEATKRAGHEQTHFMRTREIKERWPAFSGRFEGWTNLWSPEAGWVPSGEALFSMATAAQASGVRFVTGDRGWAQKLLYDSEGTCIGVLCKDGTVHLADAVVLCTGANTAALIDAKDEIVARSHCIGVIQLSPAEIQHYRALPIVDDFEQGIFFPPNDSGVIKLCSCRLITNYVNSAVPGASLGHSHHDYPEDGVPQQIESEMREFVRDIIPELADRPWASTRMCWDGDTRDVNYRICPYPPNPGLFVATAGSGHGFKMMPIIGKYVADMLEGSLSVELSDLWKWQFGQATAPTGKVPHPYPERDLGDLDGWKGCTDVNFAQRPECSI